MSDRLVELSGVTRVFSANAPAAVREVTATIAAGRHIALVGRSGSGKSTLLNLIAGLDMPTGGGVSWPALGRRETLLPRQIGVMFQSRSLIAWLTVAENVALPLEIDGVTVGVRERALAALERFELGELADKLPEELSGGQAQRVSLARATVTEPRLLLADEPTGQLDHATASRVLDTLLAWATGHGAALVIATHDRQIAVRMSETWSLDHGHFCMLDGGAR